MRLEKSLSHKKLQAVLLAAGLGGIAASATAQVPDIPAYNPYEEEAQNMRLVGYNDLQGRSAYQPWIHEQGDR